MSKRLNKIDAFESTVYTLVDWWGGQLHRWEKRRYKNVEPSDD